MRERGGNENIYKYMDEKIIFTHKVFIRYFVIGQLPCKKKKSRNILIGMFQIICFEYFVASDKCFLKRILLAMVYPLKTYYI